MEGRVQIHPYGQAITGLRIHPDVVVSLAQQLSQFRRVEMKIHGRQHVQVTFDAGTAHETLQRRVRFRKYTAHLRADAAADLGAPVLYGSVPAQVRKLVPPFHAHAFRRYIAMTPRAIAIQNRLHFTGEAEASVGRVPARGNR
ncbi:MAG: hypothetical protein BWY09_01545 [Candidatus Hydrogenedentes bacterium ADurb.Bin179]|nr:MAG: hypothetical protein BWY09_01545 [Candidatus Hydrogenedentes bacterium ADurb.Bin179]